MKGHFTEFDRATDTGFEAEVTCLSVSGRTARIGILITESTNVTRPAGMSTYITMSTVGQGGDAVNHVGADANYPILLTICPTPSGYVTPFDGTINIREEATPGIWFAQGSGFVALTTQRWQWVASSNVGGGNVKGHFSVTDKSAGTGFEAWVTCLNVLGNAARIGILITESTEPSRPAGQSTYITMSNSPLKLVGADANYPMQLMVCPAPSGYTTPFDGTINIHGG